MTQDDDKRLIDANKVWAMLGISTATLYEWMHSKGLPRPVKIGQRSRWWLHEVVAWMESLERG